MNHINTPFGFSTTRVGNVIIYACKLRINRVSESIEARIQALATAIPYASFSFDSFTNYFTIEYSVTDGQKADFAQHSIGALLKAHALDKLEAKYDWIDESKCYVYSSHIDGDDLDPQEASYQNIRELIERFREWKCELSSWLNAINLISKMKNEEDVSDSFSGHHMALALKIRALKDAVVAHIKAYPYDEVKIYEDMYRAKITALHYAGRPGWNSARCKGMWDERGVDIAYLFGFDSFLSHTTDWERNIISDARRKMLHPEYGTYEDTEVFAV